VLHYYGPRFYPPYGGVLMRSGPDGSGVVLRDDLSVDHAATERTRNALRSTLGNAKQGATE
jgi:hypothetical protein